MNVSHVSQPDRSLRLCNPPPIARSVGQYVRAVHRGDVLATFRSIDLALAEGVADRSRARRRKRHRPRGAPALGERTRGLADGVRKEREGRSVDVSKGEITFSGIQVPHEPSNLTNDEKHEINGLLAMMIGCNECAKMTEVPSVKTYWRLLRNGFEAKLREKGELKAWAFTPLPETDPTWQLGRKAGLAEAVGNLRALAAAPDGDPDDPVSWINYAEVLLLADRIEKLAATPVKS
jgi:hypothetical protein